MTHAQQVPAKVRKVVYERDNHRCVWCHTGHDITIQRRQATGMGGSHRLLNPSELVTLCLVHNQLAEGGWQHGATRHGIKVRRNIGTLTCADVPVYYHHHGVWRLLHTDGGFSDIEPVLASELIAATGFGKAGI
ncbi:MAG TPA: hypothetical protein VFU07_07255 [Candidatus Lumbricidophila sp.]|nr:hypothetical protein [Candidatus Lumbricidophila sp.]